MISRSHCVLDVPFPGLYRVTAAWMTGSSRAETNQQMCPPCRITRSG